MSTASVMSIVTQTCRATGTTLPADLVAELDRLNIQPPAYRDTARDLGRAVTEAVLAGRDPEADKGVQKALARHQLAVGNIDNMVARDLEDRRAAALNAHAGEVIAQWAEVVAEADTAARTAREAIGRLDVSPEGSRNLGPDVLPVWGRARDALHRAEQIRNGWQQLTSAASGRSGSSSDPRTAALLFSDLDADELDDARQRDRTSVTALAEDGHALALAASLDEFEERKAKVAAQRTNAQFQREADAQQAIANRLGAGRSITV